MKTVKNRHLARAGLVLCLGVLGVSQAPGARAAVVYPPAITPFWDTTSATVSFVASAAGTFTAQLADLGWPNALSSLTFTAMDAASPSQVLSAWTMPVTNAAAQYNDIFTVGAAGTYSAIITAKATAAGGYDLGAYGLTISFVPAVVPLPASEWLLAAGMLALAGFMRLTGFFSTPVTTGRRALAPA